MNGGESIASDPMVLPQDGGFPWPHRNERGYEIPDLPYGTLGPIKVIAIGAGISGISLAHAVKENGKNINLKIYEMGDDVGGTWYWNRYPGCRCDIPSVNYQMSWCPNPTWSEYYSTGTEIQQYLKGLVEKYDLMEYISLGHEVIRAEWSNETHKWCLTIKDPNGHEFSETCEVFINAGGVLNKWKWPAIEGLHSFKGVLCHTARWPHGLSANGKRIAVIGCGSSGVQILPAIQPDAKQIFHWIRSPTWITAGFAQQFAGQDGKNFFYTEEQKRRFQEDPQHALKYRKMIESELNQRFRFIVKGTNEQKAALEYANADMRKRLEGNERLIEAIVPKKFDVGCRRPTPGNGYLEAIQSPNVHVFTEMFREITEKGFVDNSGQEYEVDIIICATGFDTSYIPRFPLIVDGVNLQDRWKDYPTDSYLSIAVEAIPNYFMYYGPHGPTGHGSGAPMIEVMTRCFLNIVKKMQMENIQSMTVKKQAVIDFNEHRELYLKRTAWSQECSSWFRPSLTASPIMFPGNRVLFIELLTNFRWEDWEYEYGYAGNRFGHLGNGFTSREVDGRDTTYYYGLLDGKDEQPDYSDIRPMYAWA